MCVLLCASRLVHQWLDVPVARAYREAVQLQSLCVAPSCDRGQHGESDEAASRHGLHDAFPPEGRSGSIERDVVKLHIVVMTTDEAAEFGTTLPEDRYDFTGGLAPCA